MPVPAPVLDSPARVLRKYLISTGVVADKPPNTTVPNLPRWVAYAHKLQAEGTYADAVAVINTTAVKDGRWMRGGDVQYHHGIQIMVRSLSQEDGYLKCHMIAKWLSEHLRNTDVNMDVAAYRLHNFTVVTPVTYVGEEEKSLRHFHTLNGILTMSETTP